MERCCVYRTSRSDEIFVVRGKKSEMDFIVKYRSPGKRLRTPRHIHLVVDLYAKLAGNEALCMEFIDHLIEMINVMKPCATFPPSLEFYDSRQAAHFDDLSRYGEYSVEFFLVVTELIMLQEKTNYPNGKLNLKIFKAMKDKVDIYSVVSAATFR